MFLNFLELCVEISRNFLELSRNFLEMYKKCFDLFRFFFQNVLDISDTFLGISWSEPFTLCERRHVCESGMTSVWGMAHLSV